MSAPYLIRRPVAADAPAMAAVHVRAWQQTYRAQMSDATLDDPDLPRRREQLWRAVVTDPRYGDRTAALAEHEGRVVGIALSGPPESDDAPWSRHLFVLYVLAEHHGAGAARPLLEAVLEPSASAALWVSDPNPRAQRFYARAGFAPDGATADDDGLREIRMVRPARSRPARA